MNFNSSNVNVNNNDKTNSNNNYVRAVLAFARKPDNDKIENINNMKQNMNHKASESMELELFAPGEEGGVSLEDVFTAYFDCRRHKRGSYNALAFEYEYERKCVELWRAINAGTYRPERSIVFIVNHPVLREVFAPSFESRVVDHIIANKIEPLLEHQFIDDNYATRKGKGTLYGINRVSDFIKECSDDYKSDCYILKLDIKSYFMSLNKQQLYDNMSAFVKTHYHESDLPSLLFMLQAIIFDRPETHCVRRCPKNKWEKLPPDKSLFNSDGKHGMPIGRLTSQLCAAYTLDSLDHKIKEEWGIKYYGRYVDDMILVDTSKEHLIEVREKIRLWLSERGLVLHPKKMYLQHYRKGVLFIGAMIMPGRKYVSNRTFGFCCDAIRRLNNLASENDDYVMLHKDDFVAVINSYLGMMCHFDSYNLRQKVWHSIGKEWYSIMYLNKHLHKAVIYNRLKHSKCDKRKLLECIQNVLLQRAV